MDELTAKKVLEEVKEVLDAHNIEFWLNFGGLLGAVREGRFISYDNDIELNAWSHKVNEKQMMDICKELCRRGFNAYYSTLTDYIIMDKETIPIAFSCFALEGDKAVRPHEHVYGPGIQMFVAKCFYYLSEAFTRTHVGRLNWETISGIKRVITFSTVTMTGLLPKNLRRKIAILFRKISIKSIRGKGEYGKTRFLARFYLDLRDLEFYGMTFKVPADTEEYLGFVYGPDWRIPLKDWNFYDEDNKPITGIEFVDELWDYDK